MKNIIQFSITKGEKYYIAHANDFPIFTQGKTLDELVLNINEATALHLESENVNDVGLVPSPLISINFEFAQALSHD